MKDKVYKEIIDWLKAIVIAGIIAFVLHTFVFSLVLVNGLSMYPTLNDSERLILNKTSYVFNEPERGDIVVFHVPNSEDYIKRVIGLPGETIEMRADQLFINDKPVDEPYLAAYKSTYNEIGKYLTEDFGPVTIKEGHLFVMGDNRRNSSDSRSIGAISADQMIGKVAIRIWPLGTIGSITSVD
jgi:signal peptidase I